jgi:hypothetical protein
MSRMPKVEAPPRRKRLADVPFTPGSSLQTANHQHPHCMGCCPLSAPARYAVFRPTMCGNPSRSPVRCQQQEWLASCCARARAQCCPSLPCALWSPKKGAFPQPIRTRTPSFPLLTSSASQQLSTPFVPFGTQPYALLKTAYRRSIQPIFWICRFALLQNAGLVDLSSLDTIS